MTMNRGVLGSGPDGNKRKRSDAQAAYINSMIQGNPKLLLAESPLFEGLTQHQLPFTSTLLGTSPDTQYRAEIRLLFPVYLAPVMIYTRSKSDLCFLTYDQVL